MIYSTWSINQMYLKFVKDRGTSDGAQSTQESRSITEKSAEHTATTTYPCCISALGRFCRSWSSGTVQNYAIFLIPEEISKLFTPVAPLLFPTLNIRPTVYFSGRRIASFLIPHLSCCRIPDQPSAIPFFFTSASSSAMRFFSLLHVAFELFFIRCAEYLYTVVASSLSA